MSGLSEVLGLGVLRSFEIDFGYVLKGFEKF